MLNFLDLISVCLIGLIVSLASTPLGQRGGTVTEVLIFFGLDNFTFKEQALVLSGIAILLLVSKSILTLKMLRKLNTFLGRESANLTGDLVLRLLSASLLQLRNRSMHDSLWILTTGVSITFLQVVGRAAVMLSDLGMILIMLVSLFVINPNVAFSAMLIFGTVGSCLYFVLRRRAALNGRLGYQHNIASSQEMFEVLESYRESFVKNRRYFYAKQLKETRLKYSEVIAMGSYLPNLSRYTFDTVVICGILVFTGIQFFLFDAKTALTALALFLGASSRIAPSVLRIQQSLLELKSSTEAIRPLFSLIEELKSIEPLGETSDIFDLDYKGFEAKVSMKDVTFTYPGGKHPALNSVSLEILPNCVYAIVGPSGAGKTTLVDVLLGILPPDQGSVKISGLSPRNAISNWPGAIAYVPQDVTIMNSSILRNITTGYPVDSSQQELVNSAIQSSQLSDLIDSLPDGVNSMVGDRGTKLSGGQRQRLGLARALYTKPKLIILDEATSALDARTEKLVASTVLEINELTVITIAHKPSTMRKADFIIYVDHGYIQAVGTLAEVRSKVAEFDHQISLMSM